MPDTITVTGLEFITHIGVPDQERATEQKLLIDIALTLDTKPAATSDDYRMSIEYDEMVQAVQELQTEERKTIEKLAEDIASLVLRDFKPETITVTVHKYPMPQVQEVSLTITRS